ncbi:pyrroline-5-carboxylate reductase [Scenedesmus sp. PABB004]|nr:pyrroline-5-carboxylate reductase [Scenedesmus sp. PABB004]
MSAFAAAAAQAPWPESASPRASGSSSGSFSSSSSSAAPPPLPRAPSPPRGAAAISSADPAAAEFLLLSLALEGRTGGVMQEAAISSSRRGLPLARAEMSRRIGFMGSGQMAEALARGLIERSVVAPSAICCSDPAQARKELFRGLGATPYDTNLEVAKNSDVLFVSVKPQYVHAVLSEARPVLQEHTLVISIAAGITVAQLLEAAGPTARVCRVMPNTPCLVGETAAAMCLGGRATPEDGEVVVSLFSAVGKIYQLDEKLLAAVTGLSGSGPAYVYMMIEALADGGVRAGLPRDVAQGLAAQTVLGSAKMVLETGRHPGALKDMVTSPGGTTIAGVHELEKAGLRAACMNAVLAATARAHELSKPT